MPEPITTISLILLWPFVIRFPIALASAHCDWGYAAFSTLQPTIIELSSVNKAAPTLNLEYGDVIIFSTLLMHRSLPAKSPRLSLPCLLKNFKNNDNSFQDNRSFKIYSYSELTKIERILGNHYLSPFRLKNLDWHN